MEERAIIIQPPRSRLTGSQALASTREIANHAQKRAKHHDNTGTFPAEDFAEIIRAGLLNIPLACSLGGLGLGYESGETLALLQILQEMGRGNLAIGRVYEGHINALQLVQTFGTPEQAQYYANEVLAQNKVFGVWNAEAEDGVKLIPLENGNYRLEGCKTFASGYGYVERPFVNGMLPDGGWQMCVVPMEKVHTKVDPDWWQPPGMKATVSYKVDFSGVEVEPIAIIGEPGDYFRQPWLSGGVVRFAAVQLGGAQAIFEGTRAYLQELDRTDHPFQQERLGKIAIALQSGQLWLQGVAEFIDHYAPIFGGNARQDREDSDQLVAYANMVRTAIEQICLDVIQHSERSIGTRGLLPPQPMERIIRDLTLYLRQPAFDAALVQVGRYVLSDTTPIQDLLSS